MAMNEDVFNMQLRKFLKKVGINSQRVIEQAVRDAIADGRIDGSESLAASVRLTVAGVGVDAIIDDTINLE